MERLPKEGGEESRPIQRFQFGLWVFNVDRALSFIDAAPRETGVVNVRPTAKFYGLDTTANDESVSLFSPVRLDREYAMTTDLEHPVLIATVHIEAGSPAHLLIDGIHRLYRANVERRDQLPAYFLTAEESLSIREDPFTGSSVYWPGYNQSRSNKRPPGQTGGDA